MTEAETLFAGQWLRMRRRGTWEYVERVNPKGAVIIVALTPADEVLLVEQFRVPIGARTIEMPAGLVGDVAGSEHEDVIESAHRELLEETGWRADRIEVVMGGPSSAGMSTEVMTFARAFDLTRVHEGGGDATEEITVHRVPRDDAAIFLADHMARGYAIDPKLYAGLYFIDHDARGQPWPGR
jgi:ADP-ribose pyrophosphatase